MSAAQPVEISIVLPVFDEEDNLATLHNELSEVMGSIGRSYEIIFVDDGSTDGSFDRLSEIQRQDSTVIVVRFRRNFGQTAAMVAGFDIASGEIIVTLDADGQNDPQDIPRLLAKIDEGYDLVSGWRYERQDKLLLRRVPSGLANRLISYTTDVKLHDYGCTLKAFQRDVIKNIRLYGEMHRFIPAIASWGGVRIGEIQVNHRARVKGQSKYGISRTSRVILDLITVKFLLSYSSRPLQFFGPFGLLFGGIGVLLSVYLAVQRIFFGVPLADRPILLLAVLLIFSGLQIITVGLLAEMQTRTYHEAQDKPIYVIREILRG